jgi:hypothetical protein
MEQHVTNKLESLLNLQLAKLGIYDEPEQRRAAALLAGSTTRQFCAGFRPEMAATYKRAGGR